MQMPSHALFSVKEGTAADSSIKDGRSTCLGALYSEFINQRADSVRHDYFSFCVERMIDRHCRRTTPVAEIAVTRHHVTLCIRSNVREEEKPLSSSVLVVAMPIICSSDETRERSSSRYDLTSDECAD